MDVDPLEVAEFESHSRLNTWVAITVALIATFMGLCSVKDGNIVQVMQQNQADQIDNWGFYQARNIRETVYQSTADQLKLLALSAPPTLKLE